MTSYSDIFDMWPNRQFSPAVRKFCKKFCKKILRTFIMLIIFRYFFIVFK